MPHSSEEKPSRPLNAGSADVAAMIAEAEAEDALFAADLGMSDPRPNEKHNDTLPGRWKPNHLGLPIDCPVLPLGTDEGVYYFIDTIGQMRALKGSELSQSGINELFMGRHLWLCWAYPRMNKEGVVVAWRAEKVREDLMAACARKGPWNASDRVRGRGGWTTRDSRLIFHCGDQIVSLDGTRLRAEPIGEMEGLVYPTRPPLQKPWNSSLIGQPGPALQLLPYFRSWHWTRPELDPVLLIGSIAVGYLGGALRWRTSIVMTGDKGTGKSSLQEDLRAIYGAGLVHSADATAAGIYQKLKYDCLPVAVDEFEAKADTRRAVAILELMRASASGGLGLRGGDKGTGSEFQARSAFTFSAINMPPLDAQDFSRLALLRLKKLPEGVAKPIIGVDDLARLGRKFQRRLMDNWSRWDATYRAWREFLASCGHDGRGQDSFGTLLAAAELVIDTDAEALGVEIGPMAENYESWRPVLTAKTMIEFEGMKENWQKCLDHIRSQHIEAWRNGTRNSVDEVLVDFYSSDVNDTSGDALGYNGARKLLEQAGLSLLKPDTPNGDYELFIPNQHPALYKLFLNTKWQGQPGSGAWSLALDQSPIVRSDRYPRINGQKMRGRSFLLRDLIGGKDDKEDE